MRLTQRFNEALLWASELHGEQVRKGSGVPYVAHLLGVASLVLEAGGNEDEAIGALLHDAVEDQGGEATLREIARRFGDPIAAIVAGCSDCKSRPKPPWRERKLTYLAHLPSASPSVRLVSLADKVHNARTLVLDYQVVGEALWSRFRGGKDGTLWYYGELARTFGECGVAPLSAELARLVAELWRIADGGTRGNGG